MRRTVSARLGLELHDRTDLVFAVAAAAGQQLATESFRLELDGIEVPSRLLLDPVTTRLHLADSGPGRLEVAYDAVVLGRAEPAPASELDRILYLRPSRYCPSDALTQLAREEFGGLGGHELLAAVRDWVHRRIAYVSGSSGPTDGALDTLQSGRGVCRDFAHLTITLLRAMDMPARQVSVYAPGLAPMDFHAVVEALVDGSWYVVDATGLAPRRSMLRIATGRDAADTAFLTNTLADLQLTSIQITATVDELPEENPAAPVQLR